MKIPKNSVNSQGFYIWQACSYGKHDYESDEPCAIFTTVPMPCTPSGDYVGDVPTVRQAVEIIPKLLGMDLERARSFVAGFGEAAP